MGLFDTNIGLKFQEQMKLWLIEHPEVNHEWKNTDLTIYHPNDNGKEINFTSNSKSVTISYQDIRKEFRKELFQDIDTQVLEIQGFWINDLLDKKDLEIRKPTLKDEEVAVIHCNSKYGQVLTTDLNLFTGWGEVYKIFCNLGDAKNYCNSIKNDQIKTSVFNKDYIYIE